MYQISYSCHQGPGVNIFLHINYLKYLFVSISKFSMNLLIDNPGRLPAYNSTAESELGPVDRSA